MQSWLPKVALCVLLAHLTTAQSYDSEVYAAGLSARDPAAEADPDFDNFYDVLYTRYAEPEPEPMIAYDEIPSLLQIRGPGDTSKGSRAGQGTGLSVQQYERNQAEFAVRKIQRQNAEEKLDRESRQRGKSNNQHYGRKGTGSSRP